MRLVLRGEIFAIHDVPPGVDLPALPRGQWKRRERMLRAHARDAPLIQAELACRGVRLTDDEVRAAATRALEDDPIDGSESLAAFGDPRALPELSRAMDAFQHLDCVVCDYLAVQAFAKAIQALGGVLSPSQTAKLEAYRECQTGAWIKGPDFDELLDPVPDPLLDPTAWTNLVRTSVAWLPPPATRAMRLGRNDPCHCGSGRKYKKCHLEEDARVVPELLETRH
jgi:hypothetical protein